MTEQEKELWDSLVTICGTIEVGGKEYLNVHQSDMKAIIERYPQIKAKEADRFIRVETGSKINKYNVYSEKKVNNIYLEVKE